ncbi:MAG: hypothetical protein WC365_07495 [Candidatus Babeliales bacterium]|jgi:hypothetical protein
MVRKCRSKEFLAYLVLSAIRERPARVRFNHIALTSKIGIGNHECLRGMLDFLVEKGLIVETELMRYVRGRRLVPDRRKPAKSWVLTDRGELAFKSLSVLCDCMCDNIY